MPANVIPAPGATGRTTCTISPATNVCSIMTTASAPRGTTPPVAIDVADPASTDVPGTTPVVTSSALTASVRGVSSEAPKVSRAWTAKPSRFERSKGGTSTWATTSVRKHTAKGGSQCDFLLAQDLGPQRGPPLLFGRVAVDDFEELVLLSGHSGFKGSERGRPRGVCGDRPFESAADCQSKSDFRGFPVFYVALLRKATVARSGASGESLTARWDKMTGCRAVSMGGRV